MSEHLTSTEGALGELFLRGTDPRTAFAQGRLVRLRRGGYLPTEAWVALDEPGRFRVALAAHAWANPQAVFCGEAALLLHGIPTVKAPRTLDVATTSTTRLGGGPSTFQVRGESALAVRARGLPPPPIRRHHHDAVDPVRLGEYWTVPVADALAETLVHAKFARALTVADGVLRLHPDVPLLDRAPIMEAVASLRFATHRQRAEQIALLARAGSESPGESVSRALMLLFGFPEPVLQREYYDASGFVARTDYTWAAGPGTAQTPTGRDRVGEFDGWGKYVGGRLAEGQDPLAVIRREKRRENRLLALGHPVTRWTWPDLERPSHFRALLIESGLRPSRSAVLAIERT